MLGFFNLYTFRYSLVANHYQYLASLGAITLVSAGAAWQLGRWRPWPRRAGYGACLIVLAILASLSWRQSHVYANVETLYRATIEENPGCGMANNNLSAILQSQGKLDKRWLNAGRPWRPNPTKQAFTSTWAASWPTGGGWTTR